MSIENETRVLKSVITSINAKRLELLLARIFGKKQVIGVVRGDILIKQYKGKEYFIEVLN